MVEFRFNMAHKTAVDKTKK
uniref:Uncharacterized protein n=1 Tax=Anguilla anguilla TaxID=7936 RepID=A0A0E9U6Z5_ANGAN